jgi:acetolactate synthase-1/2/3 large subunit
MSTTENQDATSTVGATLAEVMARAGVKIAFTVPGESVLGLLDGLAANHIRVVATRNESSAAFMAEAVGQLTSRPALCIATRGPGAANMAVGLHAARADSVPLIAIVGGVNRNVRGHEAFQELDAVRAFEPIVKWAAEVKEAADVVTLAERAVAAAIGGRPGPVLLSIAADLLDEKVPAGMNGHTSAVRPEHYSEPDPALVRKVLHLLGDARRPVILAGAGVLRGRSTDALVRLAEGMRVPVIASWRRGDVFPNDNPLYLGMTGIGSPASVKARLEEADAMLVLGCRLGEMTTFGYQIPRPTTRWAQVDLEPLGASASHRPEIIMAADVTAFLRVAQRVLARAAFDAASLDERTAANALDREAYEAGSVVDAEPWDGPGVHPGRVVATLARLLPREAILTTDAGDFGTWAARGFRFHRPGTFLGSSAGPLGYGLPAAIGGALARPGRLGVALAGDGGFATTAAELETAVRERAHVLAIVFDNRRFGTIWRHQAERGSGEGLATSLGAIDFAAIAEACGALGISVESDAEFEPALRRALEAGRPALLHLTLDPSWTTPNGPTSVRRDQDVPKRGTDPAVAELEAAVLAVEALEAAEAIETIEVLAEAVVAMEEEVEAVEALEEALGTADTLEAMAEAIDALDVAETLETGEAAEEPKSPAAPDPAE